ncbi:MAG: YceI family protein [Sphingobacteriaceae bacterium]|nr:YceI family protein [Sphingobacteriaceae bacterium]
MKKIFLLAVVLSFVQLAHGQSKYMTRTGTVNFVAEGPVKDDVKAINNQAACVLDVATGDIVFQIAVKSFVFKKALMQEHFNENYLESHKYPKAVLKGKLLQIEKIDFSKNGKYPVVVNGEMDLHGVKKPVNEKGMLEVKDGKIFLNSDFQITLADYNISIPKIVEDKLAKVADVQLAMELAAAGK